MSHPLNDDIAAKFEETARLLSDQRANPFRVRAYDRAAQTLRRLREPVSAVLATQGMDGLQRLPGIGDWLARAIRDLVRLGYFPMLERLRGDSDPARLLESIPGIGPRLAARLQEELGIGTLEDLEATAHDGRLEHIAGLGPKRLEGIRDVLARRLGRVRSASTRQTSSPSVAELLDVDREYRESATAGRLQMITPRRLNPERRAWLPILHATRGDRHYTALFSNTPRAHELHRTNDWVVIYSDHGASDGQWTVVTSNRGTLQGRRIVRGREDECSTYYRVPAEPKAEPVGAGRRAVR